MIFGLTNKQRRERELVALMARQGRFPRFALLPTRMCSGEFVWLKWYAKVVETRKCPQWPGFFNYTTKEIQP